MDLIRKRKNEVNDARPKTFSELVDSLFARDWFRNHEPAVFEWQGFPAVDVCEDEHNLTVTAELPGLEEDDIHVQLMGNQLQISGEKKMEEDKKEKEYHRLESRYGAFSRTVTLPSGLRTDAVSAVYKNGVLAVSIPKVEPTPTSRIKVQSG